MRKKAQNTQQMKTKELAQKAANCRETKAKLAKSTNCEKTAK